jgi:hypothetical protein
LPHAFDWFDSVVECFPEAVLLYILWCNFPIVLVALETEWVQVHFEVLLLPCVFEDAGELLEPGFDVPLPWYEFLIYIIN